MSKKLSPKKSKRVKWAPDDNLCQVKLFVSEDCSSKIVNKAEDHLHAKTSWMLQADGLGFDDPSPGYGSKPFSETLKQTCVPQIKWKCPPKFILNNDWHVVAGEFSEEAETQKYRDMRVLETGSPRPSAIAPSPPVSPGLEECDYDDRETPVIPVIPVEEEDAVGHEASPCPIPVCSNSVAMNQDEVAVKLASLSNTPEESKVIINEKSVGVSTGLEADIVAAASAAFTAIMKSNEKGSLIDTDLLVKILSDPKMIEGLSKYSRDSGTTKAIPIYELKPAATSSVPSPTQKCHSTMLQKPLDENFNKQNVVQQNIQLASTTLTHVPSLPLSNAKPLTVLSSEQADENSNQLCKDLQSSSNTSLSVPSSVTTSELQDMNKLLQAIISTSTTLLLSGSKMEIPSPFGASLLDKLHPKRPVDGLELPEKVLPTSRGHILGSNESDFFTQPDKHLLQNLTDVDRESSQPSSWTTTSVLKSKSRASMSNQDPLMALSHRPGHLLENYGPNMMLSTEKQNQSLPLEMQRVRSFPQYSSSPSDRLVVPSVSSIKSPVVKDMDYYKSLIKLHGSQEEHTEQYRPRASGLTAVSGQGDARAKIQKPCKFFNSMQGCRKGLSCPFQHDSLLKMRAGNVRDAHSSKRFKLYRELS